MVPKHRHIEVFKDLDSRHTKKMTMARSFWFWRLSVLAYKDTREVRASVEVQTGLEVDACRPVSNLFLNSVILFIPLVRQHVRTRSVG